MHDGKLIAKATTLETSHGFHYAVSNRLWLSPAGDSTRRRSEWFKNESSQVISNLMRAASSEGDDPSVSSTEFDDLEALMDLVEAMRREGAEVPDEGTAPSASETRGTTLHFPPGISEEDRLVLTVVQEDMEDEHPEMDPQMISDKLIALWKPGIRIMDLLIAAESSETQQVRTKMKAIKQVPDT